MPLKGRAAIAIWSDMQDPSGHDHWHSHEHLIERLGIPGFLRARRMVSTESDAPRYFVLYEVADAAVTTSPEYLRCLNDPSAWTTRTMAANRGLNRTLCGIRCSSSRGAGVFMLTIVLQPQAGLAERLYGWLEREVIPTVPDQPGLTGAHLLLRDNLTERPRTHEEQLRGRPDTSIEALLLVEGYDPDALRRTARQLLASDGLAAHGAAGLQPAHLYTLAHLMDCTDTVA